MAALNVSLQEVQSAAEVRALMEVDLAQVREDWARSQAKVSALEQELEQEIERAEQTSRNQTRMEAELMAIQQDLARARAAGEASTRLWETLSESLEPHKRCANRKDDEDGKDPKDGEDLLITRGDQPKFPSGKVVLSSDPLENALTMLQSLRML
jgi:chromosome segregation ATPase